MRAQIVNPRNRQLKERRAVILDVNQPDEHDPARKFLVIGVTSDLGRYDPSDIVSYPPELYVAMKYAANGTCHTGFTRPCAACMEMIELFREDELDRHPVRGAPGEKFLSGQEYVDLCAKVAAFDKKVEEEQSAKANNPGDPPQ